MTKTTAFLLLLAAASPLAAEPLQYDTLAPAYLPAGRPALDELTDKLRAKVKDLGLNGVPAAKGKVSRALLLLPADRAGSGVLNFQIASGARAGVYQCEALGRGITGSEPRPRWREGLIAGVTIYYAPKDMSGGATVPGVYDLANISPDSYEIFFFGKPEDAVKLPEPRRKLRKGERRGFSAVWPHWYPPGSEAGPVDMLWAADSQAGSQGAGVPVFEMPPLDESAPAVALRSKQLAGNPKYYTGPYGRYGFALHTDRWEDPEKLADPKNAGRPEISDFRWRDTNGCVKLRPGCLELLNEFIDEQAGLGRRVQLEVYETAALDGLLVEDPAALRLPEDGVGAGGEGNQ
jgi:hypothetical protein